jgi:hypothetical protein
MTSQSPRIYLYKITFEEVPYYYYGVKKEKYFNQEYWGSPKTHKWCWEFYTPKKQILQFFDFTDEGWLEAQEIEKRLIKPFYDTDRWCLNESCGGNISLDVMRENGKRMGKINYELGIGIHGRTKEQMTENGKIGGKITAKNHKRNKTGIFGLTDNQKRNNSKIGGKKTAEIHRKNKTGLYGLSKEQRVETAKKTNSQKWKCIETGYVSNAGALTHYQRKRGIDTSKRVRIS